VRQKTLERDNSTSASAVKKNGGFARVFIVWGFLGEELLKRREAFSGEKKAPRKKAFLSLGSSSAGSL